MSEYKLQTKKADGTMVDIDLSVLDSKTFENVIATGTSREASNFYYGSVKVADFTTPWNIRILVSAHIPNQPNYSAMYELNYFGVANTSTYYFKIQQRSTSYRPAYYAPLYYATSAGVATYGHLLGVALRSSTNPTNASYKRTFEFKVLEQRNCKFSFFDSMLLYANVPGTGSTNYSGITEPAIAWNGLNESGDSNTTYSLSGSGATVTLTPSSGSAQSITINNVENATKATEDGDGNVISSTYLKQHQSLANYVTTNTGQDISGTKNFTSLQKFNTAQFNEIHGKEYGETGKWTQINMNSGFVSHSTSSGLYFNDNDERTARLEWDDDGDITLASSQDIYITGQYVNVGSSNGQLNLLGIVKVNGNDIPSITLNGSANSTPSFYAPTSAGTNGYYLKSNGSGAPTWAALPSSSGESNVVTSVNGSTNRTGIYAPTSSGTNLVSILAGKGTNTAPMFVKLYHGTGASDRAGSTSSSSALTNSNYYMKLDINNNSATSYSLMICYGTFSNTKKTSAVTFSMSFSFIPMVFTSLMHPGDAQSHRCQPTSITKSQFSMAYNTGQQGQYIAIGWVANSF